MKRSVLAVLASAGCACGPAVPMPMASFEPRGIEAAPPPPSPAIRVPVAAGSALASRQPVLYLQIETLDQTKDPAIKLSAGALDAARRRLEATLPRMKRFSVYTLFNRGASQLAMELNDLGEMKDIDPSKLPSPDLYLNVTITFNVEKGELDGKQKADARYSMTEVMNYRSSMEWNLADSKRRILTDVEKASGSIDIPIKQKFVGIRLKPDNTIEYKGMFNPADPENQASLAKEFVDEQIVSLTAQLALACPLTADVVGLNRAGTKFGISKGSGAGVFAGTKVVIWMKDPVVGAVALAVTEAEPTIDTSALRVLQWNESDEDAKPVIGELKANPGNAAGMKLFATTVDVPLREQLKPQVQPR